MSIAESAPPLTVALVGNPNTGKSTVFGALSGVRALTGNFPGVTVEKKIGRTTCGERAVNLVDLPGTYSLAPRTLDEMVAVNVLLGRQPDVGAHADALAAKSPKAPTEAAAWLATALRALAKHSPAGDAKERMQAALTDGRYETLRIAIR